MLYHQLYSSSNSDIRKINHSKLLNLYQVNGGHKTSTCLFNKLRLQMILIVLFYCFFTFCIAYANTQETNYYYRDGI